MKFHANQHTGSSGQQRSCGASPFVAAAYLEARYLYNRRPPNSSRHM